MGISLGELNHVFSFPVLEPLELFCYLSAFFADTYPYACAEKIELITFV